MKKVTLTANEVQHYITYADVAKFKSAVEEYNWADSQEKECNKCHKHLPLTCFGFSTSGRFPFNKDGVRYRRGDCMVCRTQLNKGKSVAESHAKKLGMQIKPSDSDKCQHCGCTKNLVFDHDHKKEMFRGWLCDPCNRSLGTLESRGGEDWLEKLIEYVNRSKVTKFKICAVKSLKSAQ